MTTQTPRTRTSRTRTRTRTRRLGALTVAFSALLSPAGKIIVGVAAAALTGGVATQLRAPSPPPTQVPQPADHTSFRLAHAQLLATVTTHIESDGEAIPIVLAEGSPANYGSAEPGAIPGLTFSGLAGGNPPGPGAQSPRFSAPQSGLPPPRPAHNIYPPGFSRPVGHLSSPPNTQEGTLPGPAAPQSGPQTEPGPDEKSAPPNAPGSMPQPGTGGPFNPPFPTSPMDPLHTADQPLPQIQQLSRATVPEPSTLGLILIGIAALAWKTRQRLTPVSGIYI